MRDLFKLAGSLLVICLVAAGLLGYVNSVTYPMIEEQNALAEAKSKMEVFANADDITESMDKETLSTIASEIGATTDNLCDISYAKKDGVLVGYTVKSASNGFGGTLTIITGIDINGNITGMKVLSHSETAGLGAKSTDPEWQAQFVGKNASAELKVIKNGTANASQVDAITGATITSKCVTKNVNYALKAYNIIKGGN